MGYSRVTVSTGKLYSRQIDDITQGRVTVGGVIPANITVEPNAESNGDGFNIDMSKASQEERQKYLNSLKGRNNVDNSDAAAKKAYDEAIKSGASEQEAKQISEATRSATAEKTASNVAKKFDNIKVTSRRKRK